MKTVRWVFYFDEGNVKSEDISADEDNRIARFVKKSPRGILHLPNSKGGADIWVNCEKVKCITRQMVDLEAERKAIEEMNQQKASA